MRLSYGLFSRKISPNLCVPPIRSHPCRTPKFSLKFHLSPPYPPLAVEANSYWLLVLVIGFLLVEAGDCLTRLPFGSCTF